MIVMGLLVLAVMLAWVRLIFWQRGVADDQRSRAWRLIALLVLQPVCAALLFLCLFPPGTRIAAGTLVVATAGAPQNAGVAAGAHLITLPEAPAIADAEPFPDLGTALRRYPGTGRITVLGVGLKPRDLDAARGLTVSFDPSPLPPGLVSLDPPARVAPGAGFAVGGQVANVQAAIVDLIDPAGRLTDSGKVDGDGRFILSGTARAAGPVNFAVRVRDARGRLIEQADLPLLVDADAAPRMLILAGAPGPEVKYLRRWATDAGFAVTTRMSAGGGIELGDEPVAMNAASLRRFDVAIIDDRSWAGLGAERAAVIGAVRDGLGLLLRVSGPLDDTTRHQWGALGFVLAGGNALAPIALPESRDPAVARTRQGIGSQDVPTDLNIGDDVLPEINRVGVVPGGSDAVPLLRDASGTMLSTWRAIGNGRVAVWSGIDSYGLILMGRRDLYGDWWSAMLSAIARPVAGVTPAFTGPAWVGERAALCGLSGDARVEQPNGTIVNVHADPAARDCGAFWPVTPGWHVLRKSGGYGGPQLWPFFVRPADTLAGVFAANIRHATLMLRDRTPDQPGSAEQTQERPGSPWMWFAACFAFSALLWWFERSRVGRIATQR